MLRGKPPSLSGSRLGHFLSALAGDKEGKLDIRAKEPSKAPGAAGASQFGQEYSRNKY